jgi:predicted small lipoprotein YifL
MQSLIVFVAFLVLAGCGLKGGLYLPPPKPKPAATQAPPADSADEESKRGATTALP